MSSGSAVRPSGAATLAWLAVTYALELVVMPAVNVAALALGLWFLAHGGSAVPLVGWMAAFMLLNLNAAAFFVALTIPMARLTDRYARKQGFHGAGGML